MSRFHPEPGTTEVVMSIKTDDGTRVEVYNKGAEASQVHISMLMLNMPPEKFATARKLLEQHNVI